MRPTATVVIPAWNAWATTQACLESLRPTLRTRDQVVVVDNGSTDGTAAGLRRYPWLTVVTLPTNVGYAAGCNAGIAVATGDVVVLLDSDTLVTPRWLDALLTPFTDITVGATGPRATSVSGAQQVDLVPYHPGRLGEISDFARNWRQDHRGGTTEVSRLEGCCLAVRRTLLTEVGGLDEAFGRGGGAVHDLCLQLTARECRLLVADEAFVHHHGQGSLDANGVDWCEWQRSGLRVLKEKHPDRTLELPLEPVLLSACLIVKDEEANLPQCLAELSGFVDEIVVYDTGSVDSTRDIARAAGAVVVAGYWDDDFGRARNSALAHCTGRWVVHVDADEQLQGDPAALREHLRAVSAPDSIQVHIANVDDDGNLSFAHTAVRIFQRLRGMWSGRLHEQVVPRDGGGLARGTTEHVRIEHSGYSQEALTGRQKHERNLRVARAEVERAGGKAPEPLLNLGRALTAMGAHDEAHETYLLARAATRDTTLLRHVLRAAAESLLDAGRPAEALTWIRDFRSHTDSGTMPDYLEGTAHLALGDTDRALALLEDVAEAHDEDFAVAPRLLLLRRGLSFAGSGRWAEASADLTAVTLQHGLPVWGQLLTARWRADLPVDDLAAAMPAHKEVSVLAQALLIAPSAADLLAEALWERRPAEPRLLAFVLQFAAHLPVERALEWSARLRGAGLTENCPLVTLANSKTAAPLDRVRAAVVAAGAFADPRGRTALAIAAGSVAVPDLRSALFVVDELAPACLADFLLGAATTAPRRDALIKMLDDLGAGEPARALLHAAA